MSALAKILTDADLKAELRWRARVEDMRALAAVTGVSSSHLYGLLNGNARLTDGVRNRLLEGIRAEELALANKLEREINGPSMLKELE